MFRVPRPVQWGREYSVSGVTTPRAGGGSQVAYSARAAGSFPPKGGANLRARSLGTTRGPLLFTKPPVSFEKLGKPVKALTQERQNLHYAYGRSGLMGVSRVRGYQRWVTNITVGGERHYLGCFTTPEEARQAYLSAKARLHPFQTIAVKAA